MKTHQLTVRRTARYATLGQLNANTRQIWFVLHGYGQLAEYFIRHFDVLNDGLTYVVAPEALSRFYLEGVGGSGRVGATWMTREDRLNEIDDYLHYLRTLHQTLVGEGDWRTGLLGFSQGTATACRWAASGPFRLDRLVLWAGTFPPDLKTLPAWERMKQVESVLVYGNQDPFVQDADVEKHVADFAGQGLNPRVVRFGGKHEIVREVVSEVCLFNGQLTMNNGQ